MYSIVSFPDDNSLQVVPTKWFDKCDITNQSFCYWPHEGNTNINRDVDKAWNRIYNFKIKRSYNNVQSATDKLKLMLSGGNTDTERDENDRPMRNEKKKASLKFTNVEHSSPKQLKMDKHLVFPPAFLQKPISFSSTSSQKETVSGSTTSYESSNKMTISHIEKIVAQNEIIIRGQAEIIEQNKVIAQNQSEILACLSSTGAGVENEASYLPEGLVLPLTQVPKLENLNKWLQEDGTNRLKLKTLLKTCGGINYENAIRNSLKKLMTNSLARQYNWCGSKRANDKSAFCQYHNILKCLLGAHTKSFPNLNEQKVKEVVQGWLKNAGNRDRDNIKKSGTSAEEQPTLGTHRSPFDDNHGNIDNNYNSSYSSMN